MKSVLSILLVLVFACAAFGQRNVRPDCPDGKCPYRVQPAAAPVVIYTEPAAPVVKFIRNAGATADVWDVTIDGRTVGVFDEAAGLFTSVDGKDKWRFKLPADVPPGKVTGALPVGCLCEPCECNGCDCRPALGQVVNEVPPGGIDADKIAPNGSGGFHINGRRVDKQTAFESLTGAGNLIDDSGRLRLTVIGQDADRKRVLADLKGNATLSALLADVIVSDYAPDAWPVQGLGFKTDGKPTLYIQAAGGKVIHRQDDYDGAERIAGAIRKAKAYDSTKDNDLRNDPKPVAPQPAPSNPTPSKPDEPVAPTPDKGSLTLIAIAAFIVFMLARKK